MTARHRTTAELIRAVRPQPSDWTALSLTAGLSATAGQYTPAWRQRGDVIELCGGITGSITNGLTIATLPAAAQPASNINTLCEAGTQNFCRVNVTSAGNINLFPAGAATLSGCNLDGVTFRLV